MRAVAAVSFARAPAHAARGSAPDELGDRGLDGVERDRLDQVVAEPGLAGALAVGVPAVAGDRDQLELGEPGQLAELRGELVAVDDRQADVEKRDLGEELGRDLHGAVGVERDARVVAAAIKRHGEHLGAVFIVVDDQDAGGVGRSHGDLVTGWLSLRFALSTGSMLLWLLAGDRGTRSQAAVR